MTQHEKDTAFEAAQARLPKTQVSVRALGQTVSGEARIQPGSKAISPDGTVFWLHEDGCWKQTPPSATRSA